jgi:hypothetical protein
VFLGFCGLWGLFVQAGEKIRGDLLLANLKWASVDIAPGPARVVAGRDGWTVVGASCLDLPALTQVSNLRVGLGIPSGGMPLIAGPYPGTQPGCSSLLVTGVSKLT